jgi:hypothetical protein
MPELLKELLKLLGTALLLAVTLKINDIIWRL